ncbi:hypothetical protein, partial [Martelella sp. UBA3392]|uniref:hypothetical protein n=1 Tax=Martelella sp. UBA3392 TaxID=1946834 RepID=UPI0031F5AD1D
IPVTARSFPDFRPWTFIGKKRDARRISLLHGCGSGLPVTYNIAHEIADIVPKRIRHARDITEDAAAGYVLKFFRPKLLDFGFAGHLAFIRSHN